MCKTKSSHRGVNRKPRSPGVEQLLVGWGGAHAVTDLSLKRTSGTVGQREAADRPAASVQGRR